MSLLIAQHEQSSSNFLRMATALGALCLASACASGGSDKRADADNNWHGSVAIGYGAGRGDPGCIAQQSRPNFDVTAPPPRQNDPSRPAVACETPIP